ncbi:MAG: family 78 glycoside hydrolase catalytic domain [Mangrovibacterium sp.]
MELRVVNLKTERKTNPVGLETPSPRFSWEIQDDKRNVSQTAYRLRCAFIPKDLAVAARLTWDSGKVGTGQSVQLAYGGEKPASGQRIWWQVKVWTSKGEESDWSEPAFFEMALLGKEDWKACWIEPAAGEKEALPFLRREFGAAGPVAKATAYVTSHGLYEFSLNGEKVGADLFTPGWTSYHKRLQYQTYDVTAQVQPGKNAIGIILADGWYRGYLCWQGKRNFYGDRLALLFQLKLVYEDGSEELVISDKSWKFTTGPLLQSDLYNGEIYDARLEMPGWDSPGFDDSSWRAVHPADYGYDNLVPSEGTPVCVTERIKPVRKFHTPKGELVFDLGQNMVGRIRFRLNGKPGRKISLSHAEVLDQEGNFYTDNLRSARAEDVYIFRGEGVESWEPRFTFHGFRYVRINDYPGEIGPDDLEGVVIHSDMPQTGWFACSDELVNRLQQNIDWGLRGNFLDVPTDCPQRDERLGWTGDAQVFAPTACFNRDVAGFYGKWMKDVTADQRADGSIPWVVPHVLDDGGGTGWSDGYGSTGWADAAVIIPWTVYQVYGNKRILEEQYDSMRGWVEYMNRESGETYIFSSGFHFGDWLSFAEYYSYKYKAPDYGYAGATTDKELIATAYFYHSTGLMYQTAVILGRKDDAERYGELLPRIRAAFQREFITPAGRLVSHTQTAYVLALAFGLLPDAFVPVAARRLAEDVKHFGHLTTGFLGTPLICQVLTDQGYPELAFRLLFNKRYPSWLYPVTLGATTIWERWDGIRPDGSFQTAGMNSFNHYAYGAVGDWLYTRVAGLRPDQPGYKRILIKPWLTDELDFAEAEYHSVYGKVRSCWRRQDGGLNLEVDIPVNTTALISIPCQDLSVVREGGRAIGEDTEIRYLRTAEGRVELEVGSGQYLFQVVRTG